MAPVKVAQGPCLQAAAGFPAVRELWGGGAALPSLVGTCHDPHGARRGAVPGDTWPSVTRVRSLKAVGGGGASCPLGRDGSRVTLVEPLLK